MWCRPKIDDEFKDLQNPPRIASKLKLLIPDSVASQLEKVLLDSFENNPVANQAYMLLTI